MPQNGKFFHKKVAGKITKRTGHFFRRTQKKCENLTCALFFFIIFQEQKRRFRISQQFGTEREKNMEKYLVLATFAGSVIALIFAFVTGKKVLSFDEGTPLMSKISQSIRAGANAYLKRQYTVVGVFFACMIVVLCIMAALKLLTWFVPRSTAVKPTMIHASTVPG